MSTDLYDLGCATGGKFGGLEMYSRYLPKQFSRLCSGAKVISAFTALFYTSVRHLFERWELGTKMKSLRVPRSASKLVDIV